MGNPKVLYKHDNMNRRDVRSVEVPSGNGIGQVRALARIYSEFATGGPQLNLRPETLEALYAPSLPPSLGTRDEVLKTNMAFSLGFWKPATNVDYVPFGSSIKAFGFPGAGGSFAFADPDAQVGFAYAMNKVGGYMWDDPREKSLRDAFYRCLRKTKAGQLVYEMAI
jgi:CubicO group peptidase (beta-lactamase class C family)